MTTLMENGWHNEIFEFNGIKYKANNHMAILRNLRNIATYCDEDHIKKILLALKAGVINGKSPNVKLIK